jgi:hypothetical protein
MKNTGFSFDLLEDDKIQQTADYEGTATGFGAVFGTLVFRQALSETSASSGSLSFVGKALLDDNSIAGGIGHGTWEQIGQEARFKIVMTVKVSDGSQHRSEGVVDHPARTFDGKMYEV